MIRRLPLIALAAALLAAPIATAQALAIDANQAPIEITCAAAGGSASTVPTGKYVLNVVNEAAWFCVAATCASGGHLKEQGFSMLYNQPTTTTTVSMSCRSTGGSGKITLTRIVF